MMKLLWKGYQEYILGGKMNILVDRYGSDIISDSPQVQVSAYVNYKFKEISQSSAESPVANTKHHWRQLFDIILQTGVNCLILFNLMCVVGVIQGQYYLAYSMGQLLYYRAVAESVLF